MIKSEDAMMKMWADVSLKYGNAGDLEEKQRILLCDYIFKKLENIEEKKILELACGNGKILQKIFSRNKNIQLEGIDYSSQMVEIARKDNPSLKIMEGNILDLEDCIGDKKYDVMYCLNSLHNLPNQDMIYSLIPKIYESLCEGGFFIFDIRNSYNPFIWYGYFKNRKKGLNFWTLQYHKVLHIAKNNGLYVKDIQGVFYNNREESFFNSRFQFLNFLYTLYIKITKIRLVSPYIFIVLEKR